MATVDSILANAERHYRAGGAHMMKYQKTANGGNHIRFSYMLKHVKEHFDALYNDGRDISAASIETFAYLAFTHDGITAAQAEKITTMLEPYYPARHNGFMVCNCTA